MKRMASHLVQAGLFAVIFSYLTHPSLMLALKKRELLLSKCDVPVSKIMANCLMTSLKYNMKDMKYMASSFLMKKLIHSCKLKGTLKIAQLWYAICI